MKGRGSICYSPLLDSLPPPGFGFTTGGGGSCKNDPRKTETEGRIADLVRINVFSSTQLRMKLVYFEITYIAFYVLY